MWSVGRESTGMMQVMLDPSVLRVRVGDGGFEERRVIEGHNSVFIASGMSEIIFLILKIVMYSPR
jgi:hypothetical protein